PLPSPVVEKAHAATVSRPDREAGRGVGGIAPGDFGRRFERLRSQGYRHDRNLFLHLPGTLAFSNSLRKVDLGRRLIVKKGVLCVWQIETLPYLYSVQGSYQSGQGRPNCATQRPRRHITGPRFVGPLSGRKSAFPRLRSETEKNDAKQFGA